MKRVIAVLLTLSILMSLCSNVLADTLRLPGSLKKIEEEAFYGDTSLDEVEIPDGVQEIGSRAFAESGVTRISIPDSVVAIADDAFENASDVTVFSSNSSFAHEYADLHGIPWINTENETGLQVEDIELSPVSYEGVTDEADIAAIEFYNSHLVEIKESFENYNQAVSDFSSAAQQCAVFLSDSIQSENDDSLMISFGSESLAFTGLSVLAGMRACTAGEPEMVGDKLQVQCTGNTGAFYLIFDGSEMTISRNPEIQARGSTSSHNEKLLQKIEKLISHVHYFIDPMKIHLDVFSKTTQVLEIKAGVAYDLTEIATRSGALKGKPTFGVLYEAGQRCSAAGNIVSGIAKGNAIIEIINNISIMVDRLEQLAEIIYHGHPTDAEAMDAEAKETCQIIDSYIDKAVYGTGTQLSMSVVKAILEWNKIADKIAIVSGGGVSPVSVIAVIKLFADLGISVVCDTIGTVGSAYAELHIKWVLKYDKALHGFISGYVSDNFSLEHLEGVMVSCNGLTVLTDDDGYYEINLNDSTITSVEIKFQKLGYTTGKKTVEISRKYYGNLIYYNMFPYVEVTGTTYAKEEDNLATPVLGGVEIYLFEEGEKLYLTRTNDRGNYTAMVPCGTFTLIFEKSGYQTMTKTFYSKADGSFNNNKDATLTQGESSEPSMGDDPTIVGDLVPIDAAHFPDQAFRDYVAQYDGEVYFYLDENGNKKSGIYKDGCLSNNERKEISNINLASSSLVSLQGVKYFFNLETLYCNNNQLTGLDVSGCANLKYLYCFDNQLTNLNVTGCVNLETLNCGYYEHNGASDEYGMFTYDETATNLHHGNQLTYLDVSSCVNLKTLQCQFNQLTSVNVSGCKKLDYLNVGTNQLTSLDISDCENLTSLTCSLNQISGLDVSGCTNIRTLLCWSNQLTSLDVSGCVKLNYLSCQNNDLTSLDVSDSTIIQVFYCHNNHITNLDVFGCTNLKKLHCYNNQLTNLDVSNFSKLAELYCYNNPLVYLNASDCKLESLYLVGCTSLETLICWGNQLTSLDVRGCTSLVSVNCEVNQLTSLNVSDCVNLEELYCWYNQLTSLDVAGLESLAILWCSYTGEDDVYSNQLTSLNVSGCRSLVELYCDSNQLTSLDVSDCTGLEKLYCSDNELTSLNVTGCTRLAVLDCGFNQLTSLDVSDCANLEELHCWFNDLTSLDVTSCTGLAVLDCAFNQLTRLEMSGFTSLNELYCFGNPLTYLDVSDCNLESLNLANSTDLETLICWGNRLTSLDVTGCTSLAEVGCASNQLTSLDLTGCSNLHELYCMDNMLTNLDVSGCENLAILWCSTTDENNNVFSNQLTSLNASGCSNLTYLYCYNNQLTNLDVSDCTSLVILSCGNNQLTSLDVSDCTSLEQLFCGNNQLTSLNVTGCVNLEYLYCGYLDTDGNTFSNQLTDLDVSDCVNLLQLLCAYNQITSLDVSGLTKLTLLHCFDNPLTMLNASGCSNMSDIYWGNGAEVINLAGCTSLDYIESTNTRIVSLDVSDCTNLESLICWGNQLTNLNVTGCTNLTHLDCNDNQLTSLDLTGCPNLTDLICDDEVEVIR